ncbi:unnamed protein product [Rhodiola kirilowii]
MKRERSKTLIGPGPIKKAQKQCAFTARLKIDSRFDPQLLLLLLLVARVPICLKPLRCESLVEIGRGGRSPMASTSSHRGHGGVSDAIRTAANSISVDSQTLVADIRKFLPVLRDVAVDLEKENDSDKVQKLEEAMIELLDNSEDCARFSSALVSVGNSYQPNEELTNFEKLLDKEMTRLKRSSSVPQNSSLLRQFKESVWNVHHAGQPMPGDEQEDLVMTGTQTSLLNNTCPLSGKPVIQLADPVRCVECKHIYEKEAIMQYIMAKRAGAKCPVAACPRVLASSKVVCDPLLLVEIDEMRRSLTNQAGRPIEDFTALDEEG